MQFDAAFSVVATLGGYLVRDGEGEGAFVRRHKLTGSLFCWECRRSGREPCDHIVATMRYQHALIVTERDEPPTTET